MSTVRDLENVMRHMTEIGPVGCSIAVTRGEETHKRRSSGCAFLLD